NTNAPAVINGLTDVLAITGGGGNTTIALKVDGTVWTWGDGNNGMLGDGSNGSRSTPGMVADFNLFPGIPVISIDGSLSNYMPIISINNVMAGQQVTVSDSVYDAVYGTSKKVIATITATSSKITLPLDALSAGDHTLTVKVTDSTGQFDPVVKELNYKVNAIAIAPVNQLSEGAGHMVVLANDGQVYTWGANWNGGIGDGTTTTHPQR
ncbi:hypothetical protein GC093_05335, partial [Paenibacillus sp. LMG 31456]|nr:hypothetical protein [Paenibacillus foliorum]